jgi:hypothetical protein
MLVTFTRAASGSTLAVIRRGDGVVLELPGYDRRHRTPHDLAHAVTERELGLAGGLFGSIAGGAVFANMRVVGGRPRHDAAARSRRLLRANRATLGTAEVLAGVVHDAAEHGTGDAAPAAARRAWAAFNADPFPWAAEQVTGAVWRLAELAAAYRRTGAVSLDWPDTLCRPVPAPPAVRRGRPGGDRRRLAHRGS